VAIDPAGAPANQAVTLQIDAEHTGVAHTPCPTTPADLPLWDVPVGGDASFALIAGGRVFVTVGDRAANDPVRLLAFDAATGATLWGPVAVADNFNVFATANAAFANDTVFVVANADPALPINPDIGFRPGSVQAYAAATGDVLWRTELARNGSTNNVAGIVPGNGRVYVLARSQVAILQAFDQATGVRVIQANGGFGSAAWPAVTANSVIFTGDCATQAFSAATGGLLWQQAPFCSGGGGGVPVIADGFVYSFTRSPSGTTYEAYDAISGSLAGAFNRGEFVAIRDGILYGPSAVHLATNTQRWAAPADATIAPLLVNDLVLTGNPATGELFGLDAGSGTLLWTLAIGDNGPFGTSTRTEIAVGENLLVVSRGDRLKAYRVGEDL